MLAKGPFTTKLWEAVSPIYEDILKLPFIKELCDGSLNKKSFAHYVSQDILYLYDDARAFIILADKAENDSDKKFFKILADEGFEIEHAMHQEFLEHFDIKEAETKSMAIQLYTDFLLNQVKNTSFVISAATLLPCYWLYNEVGNYIIKKSTAANPYKKWIDTYEGDDYMNYTSKFISIVETEAKNASEDEMQQMLESFIQSAKYEYEFWKESYIK